MRKVSWQEENNLSQKTVCQNIVETIGKVFSVDLAILVTVDPQDRSRGYFSSYKSAAIFSSFDSEYYAQIALETESVLVVNDVETDRQWQKKYHSLVASYKNKIRSILALPLTCQYNLRAYLNLYSSQEMRIWQQEEVGLAMMMAAQAGLALSQTYAYEEMKVLAQREVTLNRITGVIRSSLEPQAIYNSIVTELGSALNVSGCALSLWKEKDRYMRCVALYNPEENSVIPQETRDWQRSTISLVPIAENPILQQLLRDYSPVCLCDLQAERDLARFDLPWRSQSRALLVVPLIFDGSIMGSITLREESQSRYWRNADIELAKAVASHAAIAVTQAKLYETSRRQAIQLQASEQRIRELNNYLTESILKRFLPEAIVNKAAMGKLTLGLSPEPHLVTVLFADLVGFTRLSSQLKVDVLSELLNDYLEAMTQAVFEHSGTIDKFVGDGIMALFGAPENLSAEEQAQRAIATAKTMYSYLKPLNDKWQAKEVWIASKIPDLMLRCGIHQGHAVVGMFGGKQRKDYTAIGKVVNIAARLQRLAYPNQIFFSETVFNCLDSEIQVVSQPKSLQLKGIESDFRSYALSVSDQTKPRVKK